MDISAVNNSTARIAEIASRIKEMRCVMGLPVSYVASAAGVSDELYERYESGVVDLPFSFIYSCAKIFDMELTELLEGNDARLSSYTITRRGKGQLTSKERGISISNLAPLFRKKVMKGSPTWFFKGKWIF